MPTGTAPKGSAALSFTAPAGEVADWRWVLLCDVATSTGVFEALPGTLDDIAGRTNVDAHSLRVVLDALVSLGAVEREGGARHSYALGPNAPDAAVVATVRHHARALRRWASSLEPRLRGEALDEPPGGLDPEMFHDSLAANARRTAPEVVDACLARFPDAKTVLDLGGLHGEYSLEFTRRGLTATMQDQPAMIDVARRRGRLEEAGVRLFAGSFFETVPDGPFDLAFCSGITHTFDGERNLALYRNLRPVVAPGGGVAVVTFLRWRNPATGLFAIQMLLNANGGDTHAEAEYRAWLEEASFKVDENVVDLPVQGARSVIFAT